MHEYNIQLNIIRFYASIMRNSWFAVERRRIRRGHHGYSTQK